ncbi:MAG: ABC transporter substrate-binding protein [Bacillota bacterium]
MIQKHRFGLTGLTWVLVLTLLALTGCGGAKPAEQPAAKEPAKAAEQPKQPEFRTVKHFRGETKVPVNPQRIVVLDTGELDSMVALGIKPVGAVTVFQDGEFQDYLKDKLEGVAKVGTINQPNLEAIAALKPDLIISSDRRHKAIYDKLSQIAPTVFTESVGVTWKENFRLHAEAVNKAAEAEKIMAAYDKRMAEFRQKMGPNPPTVSIIRGLPDHVRIYMNASFIGTVMKDAGLPRPPVQNKDVFMEKATEERIPDLDADLMFYTQFRGADGKDTLVVKLQQHPLWSQLNVVKKGQVYEVPDDYWMIGIGITAANKVLDDLFKLLVK